MKKTQTVIPTAYSDLLTDLKKRVQTAHLRASVAVNRELVFLYWTIGREILSRQAKEGWGSKIIDRLAKDLHAEFPELTQALIRTSTHSEMVR